MKLKFLKAIGIFLILLVSMIQQLFASKYTDSLRNELKNVQSDTSKAKILNNLAEVYAYARKDSGLFFAHEALNLSEKINFEKQIAFAYYNLGLYYRRIRDFETSEQFYLKAIEIGKKSKAHNIVLIAYGDYSFMKIRMGEFLQSIKLAEELLPLAIKQKDTTRIIDALNSAGVAHKNLGNYKEAVVFYDKMIHYAEANGNQRYLFTGIRNKAIVFKNQGNYAKALEFNFEALKIAEEIQDSSKIQLAYNSLGVVYKNLGEYVNALKYYEKGLKIATKLDSRRSISSLNNNMAILYNLLEKYDLALEHGKRSLAISTKSGDINSQTFSYSTIGNSYYYKKDFDKALEYYFKVLEINKKLGDKTRLANNYNNIGLVYLDKKEYQKGIEYAFKALELAEPVGEISALKSSSKVLYKSFKNLNDPKNALKYYEDFIFYKDSLTNEAKAKEIGKLEAKYENEKQIELLKKNDEIKNLQLQQSEAQVAKQKLIKNVIIVLSILLILIALGAYYRYREDQKRKEEKLQTDFDLQIAHVEMTALRAQMNPHFLFNCLNSIKSYVIENDQKSAAEYLNKFARLIRLILQNSKNELVSLENELEALKIYIEMEAMRFDDKFDFEFNVDEQIDTEFIEIPPLILQPYVENSIWHGLMHKEGKGHIKIEVQKVEQGIKCVVEDNGVGREKSAELKSRSALKKKSMGMQITKDRLAIINSLYKTNTSVKILDLVDSYGLGSGTRVEIEIPVK